MFKLKHSVPVTVCIEEDGYLVSNDEFNVHAYGETKEEALDEWKKVFIDLFLSYRQSSDKDLTPAARILKQRLIEVIEDR